MQSALKNFTLTPGVSFNYPFTFYQGGAGSQSPVDLTDATATLNLNDGAGNVLFQIISGATQPSSGIYFGGTESDPTNGVISVTMDIGDIAGFVWKYATYTLSVDTTSLGNQTVLYGAFTIVGFLP
jgi:hypothetical protein